jgi:hypothetical protein
MRVFIAHLPTRACVVAIACLVYLSSKNASLRAIVLGQTFKHVVEFMLLLTLLDIANKGLVQTGIILLRTPGDESALSTIVDLLDRELGESRATEVQVIHWLTAVFIASKFTLELPVEGRLLLQRMVVLTVGMRVLFFSWRCVEVVAESIVASPFGRKHALTKQRVSRVVHFLWYPFSLAFVFAIAQNLGLELGALITGFGVGGVALALSAQEAAKDVLAMMSIIFFKPFVEGDVVIVAGANDLAAKVERITPKYTFLRAFDGEALSFANRDISNARVRNFGGGTLERRRIRLALPLSRDSTLAHLDAMPGACYFMYRYILRESCSQFDSLPLTSSTHLDAMPALARRTLAALVLSPGESGDVDPQSVQCFLESATEECYRFEVLVVLRNVANWRAAHGAANMALLHALRGNGVALARPHTDFAVDAGSAQLLS